MKIGICSDHAGFEYKCGLIGYLEGKGYEMSDYGTDSPESMDYPDVAHPLAEAVEKGTVDLGIALCGTGNGMAMTLNKHQGIRAGLAWNKEIGELDCETEVSQIFMAIDLSLFPDKDGMEHRIGETLSFIDSSIPREDGACVHYPGEGMMRKRRESERLGVYVDDSVWEKVQKL